MYAWPQLSKKYNLKTMAGRVRDSEQVVRPPQVKEVREVETALASWREHYRRLQSAFPDKPSDAGQVACGTSVLPKRSQEHVHVHMQAHWALDSIMERMRALCASRVGGPFPMEVDTVEEEEQEEQEE